MLSFLALCQCYNRFEQKLLAYSIMIVPEDSKSMAWPWNSKLKLVMAAIKSHINTGIVIRLLDYFLTITQLPLSCMASINVKRHYSYHTVIFTTKTRNIKNTALIGLLFLVVLFDHMQLEAWLTHQTHSVWHTMLVSSNRSLNCP